MRRMSNVQDSLMEFAELNRRRLFGCPPLAVGELERWQELQANLVKRFQADSGEGRRVHERLPTHLHVDVKTGEGDTSSGPSMNLSEGGIFLASTSLLEVGTHLELTVANGETAIDLQGVVAWTRAESTQEGPRGMGVRFTSISNDQRTQIGHILELKQAATAD